MVGQRLDFTRGRLTFGGEIATPDLDFVAETKAAEPQVIEPKAAAQAAWEGVIRPVFEAIGGWITGTLVPAFMNFWQGVIVPAWRGIGGAVKQAWEGTILPALTGITDSGGTGRGV